MGTGSLYLLRRRICGTVFRISALLTFTKASAALKRKAKGLWKADGPLLSASYVPGSPSDSQLGRLGHPGTVNNVWRRFWHLVGRGQGCWSCNVMTAPHNRGCSDPRCLRLGNPARAMSEVFRGDSGSRSYGAGSCGSANPQMSLVTNRRVQGGGDDKLRGPEVWGLRSAGHEGRRAGAFQAQVTVGGKVLGVEVSGHLNGECKRRAA